MLSVLALAGAALAMEPTLLLGTSADLSVGPRTLLVGFGGHPGLALELGNDKNAVHIEPRAYLAQVEGALGVLPGAYVGWTHHYGEGKLQPWSLVGVGGYRSNILPVLPVLALSGGVAFGEERVTVRVGPNLFALPPFFVGGGIEAALGFRF